MAVDGYALGTEGRPDPLHEGRDVSELERRSFQVATHYTTLKGQRIEPTEWAVLRAGDMRGMIWHEPATHVGRDFGPVQLPPDSLPADLREVVTSRGWLLVLMSGGDFQTVMVLDPLRNRSIWPSPAEFRPCRA